MSETTRWAAVGAVTVIGVVVARTASSGRMGLLLCVATSLAWGYWRLAD